MEMMTAVESGRICRSNLPAGNFLEDGIVREKQEEGAEEIVAKNKRTGRVKKKEQMTKTAGQKAAEVKDGAEPQVWKGYRKVSGGKVGARPVFPQETEKGEVCLLPEIKPDLEKCTEEKCSEEKCLEEKCTEEKCPEGESAQKTEEAIEQIRRDMQKGQYYLQCQYAIGIVEAKVKILDEQLSMKLGREIVRNVAGRIKTPESIYAKLVRKELPTTLEAAKERLNDLVGIRIVCLFLDDVYEIANSLKKQKDVTVVKEKDYIAKPKKNGYMSLHLIVDIPVCFEEAQENKRVEIQIRTLAMDFWSVLEYQLMYKKNVSGSEKAARELKNYSEEIAAMDRKMLHLRNRIDEI